MSRLPDGTMSAIERSPPRQPTRRQKVERATVPVAVNSTETTRNHLEVQACLAMMPRRTARGPDWASTRSLNVVPATRSAGAIVQAVTGILAHPPSAAFADVVLSAWPSLEVWRHMSLVLLEN